MKFHTVKIYHPLDIHIVHQILFFPPPCSQKYFLLIGVLVHQGRWLTAGVIGGIIGQEYCLIIGWSLVEGGKLVELSNIRDKLKELLLLHPTIPPLFICLPKDCLLKFQWILQNMNLYLQEQQLIIFAYPLNLMLLHHHLQYILRELLQHLKFLHMLYWMLLLPNIPNNPIPQNS